MGLAIDAADHAGGDGLAPIRTEAFDSADAEDMALVEDGVPGADEFGLAMRADVEAAAVVDVAPFRLGWRSPGVVVDVAAGAAALAALAEDHRAADVAVGRVEDPQLESRRRCGESQQRREAGEEKHLLHGEQDKAGTGGYGDRMQEILDGVFHWKAKHPKIGIEVGCHFVAASGTAIDPLLPHEGIGWFDEHPPQRIVLSTRHHLRHAPELAERFGCPILCHESGLYEFEGGPAVEGFAFGDRLADDLVALEMNSISPDDAVLRIEAGEGALLFADAVIHYGSLGFVPDKFMDDPESVKVKVRLRCAALLKEGFEHLLFAHGDPLLDSGREALREFATSDS